MKRYLLVLVLAVAFLGLLAAPTSAQPVLQDGVYVYMYNGHWFQMVGGEEVASGDAGRRCPPWSPRGSWRPGRRADGPIESIGTALVYSVDIDGQSVVSGGAASKALWSAPFRWETDPPFNPRMGVEAWAARWLYQIRPGLGAGTHEVLMTETFPHRVLDLFDYGLHKPGHLPAGSTDYSWQLVLQ